MILYMHKITYKIKCKYKFIFSGLIIYFKFYLINIKNTIFKLK